MLTRFGYFLRETLISLRRNLLMTIAGIMTVTVSLALFGGIQLLSKWVDHGTEVIKGGVRLEIFMNVNATETQIGDVRTALESDQRVKTTKYIDKAAAYEEAKRIFAKDPDLLRNTDANTFPASFRVAPRKAELTEAVKRSFQNYPGVDEVSLPSDALRGLLDATNIVTWIFRILAIVLLASSLFLIVNTIRLATFARRREIDVMTLVGASNWFVRIPFMAEGLVQGIIGAAIAVFGVWAVKVFVFDDQFQSSKGFFARFFVTGGDVVGIAVFVLILGVVIGIAGSTIGLRRFLRV